MTKNFITTTEAGILLGVTRVRVWQLIQDEKIPAMLVGNTYLIKPSDVRKYIEDEKDK